MQRSELEWTSELGQTFALCPSSATLGQAEPSTIIFLPESP